MNTPEMLSRTQFAGLLKIGDILVPGDAQLPSFSASQCAREADRMLRHMPDDDRNSVRLVLGLFGVLPRLLVRGIYWLTDQHRRLPESAAAPFRLANLGIKGVVMTLYYSDLGEGESVYEHLHWDARIVTAGEPGPGTAPVPTSPIEHRQPAATEGPPSPQRAFTRARHGQRSLRRLTLTQRLRCLSDLKRIILARREAIIDRIQQDTGKSRSDALISEIFGVLDNLAWLERYAPKSLADRKEHTPIALMGKTSWTWYEPLGTILIISPWNYPFYQAIVPIACAFAAGNTVVYKPSEWTPLEGLVEDLLADAQFAPNWVQVVYGDGTVGSELIEQKPDRIFFTGSTRTGRKVLAQAAPHLIPVELELGGKDAMIVFEDVNIERAAAGAAWGALTTTGQSCTSVERVYVQESIYDAFKAALVREVERLKQEIDRDGNADLGAMTTDFQVQIVARHLEDAKAKGALVLTGKSWDGTSRLIPPMVIDRVTNEMLLAREETFGPVIPLFSFRDEEDAIRLANDSEYGLTASVWTKDLERATRVSRALEVGGVSINNVMATEANPALPFGGVKNSGFGRYKGEHGLHAFCNVKSVLVDKDSAKIEANWYPYTKEKYRLFTELTVSLFTGGWRSFIKFAFTGMKLERYSNRVHKQGRR
jgi:aldehyde dehydrogenase (NAD+)